MVYNYKVPNIHQEYFCVKNIHINSLPALREHWIYKIDRKRKLSDLVEIVDSAPKDAKLDEEVDSTVEYLKGNILFPSENLTMEMAVEQKKIFEYLGMENPAITATTVRDR
ncbi:uncharacterized protein LOC111712441 [Eurytemora carolleeae]|uniref:uncharacterized protein LOC111712441 n=1 Tax=Eurytemora carolleeae TaxID=1294199 RepID=UPI000C7709DA|nr:uncharacterized protein LOC111712441 [Eurytemora carolleeae]|eukprot:XP_023342811.1 uncharacterized protein LOC111712441 [Eurytemora affinis]